MRVFECAHCGQLIYFENTYCERCGHSLGFVKNDLSLYTLGLAENNTYQLYKKPDRSYKYCANHVHGVCNWMVPASSPNIYCEACELNKTIPDISNPANVSSWRNIENAKHRLLYTLYRLNLPVMSKLQDPVSGLAFEFLANEPSQDSVMTGHEHGLITINIEEADAALREQVRQQMGEQYRTLLGHFRHETGHYYWDRLILNTNWLQPFRDLFGDEQPDYAAALQNYYANGAPQDWQQNHITVYASSHPWEDWAETWAHYLHMMDTLETGWSFGLNVMPGIRNLSDELVVQMDTDPYQLENFDDIVKRWLPFTYAMNSINRSMGLTDLYPFVMSQQVISKLAFIHSLCRNADRSARPFMQQAGAA